MTEAGEEERVSSSGNKPGDESGSILGNASGNNLDINLGGKPDSKPSNKSGMESGNKLDGKSGNKLSRRSLVAGGLGACAMLAIGGTARLALGENMLVRPPGGQDEEHLLANCIRCDRCRSACPNNAIGVASLNDGLLMARTPKMEYRKGYCDFCVGFTGEASATSMLCIANCPTGALKSFDYNSEWISPAVVDDAECIAFAKQGGCRVCADKCPYSAITLDAYLRPVVDESLCNGCGYCEYVCPSHSYRSYSGSPKRGINIIHTNDKRPPATTGGQP